MSDRGLSDELVAAACKDGDPITKVRMVVFAVLTRELSFFLVCRTLRLGVGPISR